MRIIDEVMGHRSSGRTEERGSAIWLDYRHTTREMERRIATVIDERIHLVQRTAMEHLAITPAKRARPRRPTAPRRPQHAKSATGS